MPGYSLKSKKQALRYVKTYLSFSSRINRKLLKTANYGVLKYDISFFFKYAI